MQKPAPTQAQEWNTHVSHPLQSWEWGEFREKTGVTVVRIHDHVTPFQCTLHKLPKVPFYIGYIPKGPPIDEKMLHVLESYGKKHNVIFFQLEPNTIKNSAEDKEQENIVSSHASIKYSHHPLFTKFTFVLDLTKSEEVLLSSMHPKTRYNIKVAKKHNVIIQQDNSPEAFETYLALVEETTARQGFYAHSLSYHKKMWQTLSPSNLASLWTARYNNETVAAWILFSFKNRLYYPYGASSRNHRNVMAPQLLLWEIVRWAKKEGYISFDLWGALGPNPDENDPFYGFHRFKSGFNPDLVECSGSFDVVIHPMLYTLYCLADTIRWKILKKIKST